MRHVKTIAIFFAALILMEVLYRITSFTSDLKKFSPEQYRLLHISDSADILFFGESSNTTFAPYDSIPYSIAELAAQQMPAWRWKSITKHASHAGIYNQWLNALNPKSVPACIVITVNLRSCNADWRYSALEPALQQALVMGKARPRLLNRFLLALGFYPHLSERLAQKAKLTEWDTTCLPVSKNYPYKTVRAWDDAFANGYYCKPDGSWDMDKIQLACHYIKSYAFALHAENSRIKDLDAIVQWAQIKKCTLVFNIMAENLNYAETLVGPELTRLMRFNRDFIVKRYSTKGVLVIDHLESVKGADYIDQNWTTEHYNQNGRIAIAKKLSQVLLKNLLNP